MRGLLIYDKVGHERNKWFINRLIKSAKKHECELELVIYEDSTNESLSVSPDFAIVRTINPDINKTLEQKGIRVFNNSTTSRIANDKWETVLLCSELGIETMDTIILNSHCDFDSLVYPLVIKTVDGHGGNEVFLTKNALECKYTLSKLKNKRVVAQQLCDEPGVDMRVYVMGDKIIAATKRTSDSDFRSNFSLGGKAEIDTPTEDMVRTIKKIRSAMKFDFVGVDFIRHQGRWVLNEIEDVVGTRMLYSLTDIDAAEKYIEYITGMMKENLCTTS